MRFTSILASVVLATGAFAVPTPTEKTSDIAERATAPQSSFTATPIFGCLQPWQANNIVTAFLYLLANPKATNFNATVNALFSSDFTDTSDSINQLAGKAEGSVTFANKADFISSSSAQDPLYLQTLDTFNSCNKIGWRWISISGTGNNAEKVKGIDVFNINQKGQIQATYAEFNSGAWLADLGYPECAGKK